MRGRSSLSLDFGTGHFQVCALVPSNLLSFQSQLCCVMVMLCLSSLHRQLEGVNMHTTDVPGVTVAGGKHCFIYVGRKWCSGLAICPNSLSQMSIYASIFLCFGIMEITLNWMEERRLRSYLLLTTLGYVTLGKELEFSGP